MAPVRTRFAPSPTGYLHVGGARTALFNWLYARHTGGKFILRIEDTDAARSTDQSVQAIFEALKWLDIDWDEGPFYQSQRLDIYNAHIDRLVAAGHAYHCTCTPEQIEAMREKARATGAKPRYDGTCREKKLGPSSDAVVRFKSPTMGSTLIEDVVKGHIVFSNDELDDFVLRRTDGMPTYNFAAVVDDVEAAIAHIRRYSSGHSDAIVSRDQATIRRFVAAVDSAAVLVNASTRFTDGGEFGFGAEIGISTQKLHARGPMGLPEMTSTKYVVVGDGHVR